MPRTSKDRQKRRRGSDSSADAALMERLQRRGHDDVQQLKHVETFYEKPPPSLIKENDDKPEDCIPDLPGNENARDFLASAPSKGLWMPLGKEVKVMQYIHQSKGSSLRGSQKPLRRARVAPQAGGVSSTGTARAIASALTSAPETSGWSSFVWRTRTPCTTSRGRTSSRRSS
ncbi:retinitis pigmentosa 9 protein-like isoform X2 [Lethenteron reissneri]|uniref:retinitis pigmentosa 9 protein-like isoform X2 n=1 Tax=Lethenteron reissneri TaxID=7753 RepID=UPI002AB69408|nr:retinitis pigmentosa 9 protein-like isoform X2 [Lethenteron reissneri]